MIVKRLDTNDGSSSLKIGIIWAIFQIEGNIFSKKDLLNNDFNGCTIEHLIDFNILWLIQSGPMALFTGSIVIMSDISCSSMIMLLKLLFNAVYISGSVTLVCKGRSIVRY